MKTRIPQTTVSDSPMGQRPDALGESEAFLDFQQALSRAAKVNRPVLIIGERGTGKELAVSRLHYLSSRWQGPLVALNCAALAPGVLESELFGHEAGSFTGAARRRQGRFESAEGGTLFLDEIGLVPIEVQEKILRAVEYRQFERVGGSDPVTVDVRIIGATNANLPALARAGKFKEDLLDRLSFEVLRVPPLRERQDDIMLLANHFAARMGAELGRADIPRFSTRAEKALIAYPWPGNVRELKNVVERAVYRSSSPKIDSVEFDPFAGMLPPFHDGDRPPHTADGTRSPSTGDRPQHAQPAIGGAGLTDIVRFEPGGASFPEFLEAVERDALLRALQANNFHQGKAAEWLGLGYHQFRALFRKHRAAIGS
jgi:psp operon transcriptional activator